jgi:hypothetical protein
MSPVPLKKQSMAGTLTPNIRGIAVEVMVDPTTERNGSAPGLGNEIEVIMM